MKTDKLQTPPKKILSPQEIEAYINKIERSINELKKFDINTIDEENPAHVRALRNKLIELLEELYGHNTPAFHRHAQLAELYVVNLAIGPRPSIQDNRHKVKKRIDDAITQLESIKNGFIEELEDADTGGSVQRAIKAYQGLELHPKIAGAASKRYLDGHCADAIEASVKVLNELVRLKSGLSDLDGVSLMTRVFGGDNPLVRFNSLLDASDKEEQKGFMFLFSGAVSGLRNPRAHKIIEDDPKMALKFIAFVSLLAELLDKAT
jgi:uncharacterized protein (TIGR02391 family)